MERERLMQDNLHSSEDEKEDDGAEFNRKQTIQFKPETVPIDNCHVVCVIFLFYGIVTTTAWSFFFTATGYWMYKFRQVNSTESKPAEYRTELQTFFNSYLSIAATLPAIVFLLLNAVISKRVSRSVRLISSVLGMLVCFIATTVLTKINTDTWQVLFFAVTMLTVVVLNSSSAIFQGAAMGLSAAFPSRFMQANMNGQALGGILAVLCSILALAFGLPDSDTAFIFFMAAVVILILTLISYYSLRKNIYYRHHTHHLKEAENHAEFSDIIQGQRRSDFLSTFKKTWLCSYVGFITFVGTLCVFPAVVVLVVSTNADNNTSLTNQYFIPVGCLLIFNLGDLTGRVASGMLRLPSSGSIFLPLLSTLRLGLVPMIMMCNAQPRQYLPVIFSSDVEFVVLSLALGLSNGYFVNLAAIFAPKCVPIQNRELAGSIMAFSFGVGLSVGALLSSPIVSRL